MKYDPLIFGKSDIEKIVALEVKEANVYLYIQTDKGTVKLEKKPYKYWLLADRQVNKSFVRLKGDQHFKWGKQYSDREEYYKNRYFFKKSAETYYLYDDREAAMIKDGYTLFKGMKHKDVSILSFDIETTGLQHDIDSKVLLIANTFRDSTGNIQRRMFTIFDYETPIDMLDAWCEWVREVNPSIICGHNILSFDLPYLQHVAELNKSNELLLGRDGSPLDFDNRDSKFRKDGSQFINYKKIKCFGRHIVDTMFLSIKYDVGRKYENYKLKSIIAHEGLEVEGRVFYDAETIKDNYTIPEEWEKIKEYAKFDGDDALALYDLMSPAQFYWTQSIPKTYQSIMESATGSQINALLVRSYLQNGFSVARATEMTERIEGGISFGVPGIYSSVLKVDLKSAYPSQILRFKLYNPEKDPEGNFYKMVHYFTYERFRLKDEFKATKDRYFNDREQTSKIAINSAYGVTITEGLNYNSPELGEKITRETREVIDMALKWASGKDKNYWIDLFEEKTNAK